METKRCKLCCAVSATAHDCENDLLLIQTQWWTKQKFVSRFDQFMKRFNQFVKRFYQVMK